MNHHQRQSRLNPITVTITILTLIFLGGYLTRPTEGDIVACQQSTNWDEARCRIELTR